MFLEVLFLVNICKLSSFELINDSSSSASIKMLVVDVWTHKQERLKELDWVWLQGRQRALNRWSQTHSRTSKNNKSRKKRLAKAGSLTKAESLTQRLQGQDLQWNYNEREAGTTQRSCSVFYTNYRACEKLFFTGTGGLPVLAAGRRDSRMGTNWGCREDREAGTGESQSHLKS